MRYRVCAGIGVLTVVAGLLPAAAAEMADSAERVDLSAMADKHALHRLLRDRSQSAGLIAKALAASGQARVVVHVADAIDRPGRERSETDRRLRDPVGREQARLAHHAAVAPVIADALGARADSAVRFATSAGFAATVSAAELARLAADPRVASIEPDLPVRAQLDDTRGLIGAPRVHTAGGTGAGRTVAVLDQGLQRDHPFIGAARIRREGCFLHVAECPNGRNGQTTPGAAAALGGEFHGTHVAGIAIGGNARAHGPGAGIAPGADLIHIAVLDRYGAGYWSNVVRGLEYLEDLVVAGGAGLRVDAVNLSLSGGAFAGHCDAEPGMAVMTALFVRLRGLGVLATAAAGNGGERDAMGAPACISTVISVGAVAKDRSVASYGNLGATTDLLAPGGDAAAGGCVVSSVPRDGFRALCGTSMAAPHVAGAIAALRSLRPGAPASVVEAALKRAGPRIADQRAGGRHSPRLLRLDRALAFLDRHAPPANDDLANATRTTATGRFVVAGHNVGASLEAGEPRHGVPTAARSVWWSWRATGDGPVTLSSLGSGFDAILTVHDSGATDVRQLGAAIAAGATAVTFDASAGHDYKIAVAGRAPDQQGAIELTFDTHLTPANDDFARARILQLSGNEQTGHELVVAASNVRAGREPGEPILLGSQAHTSSVWYRFVAPRNGAIRIDTSGSSFDTLLGVYTGSRLGAATLVAADDDSGDGVASEVAFASRAGTAYRILVTGFNGRQGDIVLRLRY